MAKGLRTVLRPVLPTSVRATYSFDRRAPARVITPLQGGIEGQPRVPFFRDPRHTGPTRALYRALLRQTPVRVGRYSGRASESSRPEGTTQNGQEACLIRPGLRRKINESWRRRRGSTSITMTSEFLQSQLELLDKLRAANSQKGRRNAEPISDQRAGMEFKHDGVSRDESAIAAASATSSVTALAEVAALEAHLSERYAAHDSRKARPRRRPRPRLTGGFLRPTLFNVPLPRLKPQPLRISMMIRDRRQRRERRIQQRREWDVVAADMRAEVNLWRTIGLEPPPPGPERRQMRKQGKSREWEDAAAPWLAAMQASFDRENERAAMVFDEALVARVEQARKRRGERIRRRGELRKKLRQEQGVDTASTRVSKHQESAT